MLDKDTLLRQRDFLSDDEESFDNFICCLERAKDISESNESLQKCIERTLEKWGR